MSEDHVYGFRVLVSRSYFVGIKAKSKKQAQAALDAGRIQTSDIHERCAPDDISVDDVEYDGELSDGEESFDVTDYRGDGADEPEFVINGEGDEIHVHDRVRLGKGDTAHFLERATDKLYAFDEDDKLTVLAISDECGVGRLVLKLIDDEEHIFHCVSPDELYPVCEYCGGDGLLSEPMRTCDDCAGTGIAGREWDEEPWRTVERFLVNDRGEKIFVGDYVVATHSVGHALLYNSVKRETEVVFSNEALQVLVIDGGTMALSIGSERIFEHVSPAKYTPLCTTCDGAGIDANDDECPDCEGTGTPKRNML